eukprot:7383781-Prymnesium_polylepis.1
MCTGMIAAMINSGPSVYVTKRRFGSDIRQVPGKYLVRSKISTHERARVQSVNSLGSFTEYAVSSVVTIWQKLSKIFDFGNKPIHCEKSHQRRLQLRTADDTPSKHRGMKAGLAYTSSSHKMIAKIVAPTGTATAARSACVGQSTQLPWPSS